MKWRQYVVRHGTYQREKERIGAVDEELRGMHIAREPVKTPLSISGSLASSTWASIVSLNMDGYIVFDTIRVVYSLPWFHFCFRPANVQQSIFYIGYHPSSVNPFGNMDYAFIISHSKLTACDSGLDVSRERLSVSMLSLPNFPQGKVCALALR